MCKIIQNTRSQFSKSRSSFIKQNLKSFRAFIDNDSIESRILPRIWSHLQSLSCKHICPGCGVPCCGLKTCNDLYQINEPRSNEHATIKHSCQFHRDTTITGTVEVSGYVDENNPGKESDILPNYGACPELIRIGRKQFILDPQNPKKVGLRYDSFILRYIQCIKLYIIMSFNYCFSETKRNLQLF